MIRLEDEVRFPDARAARLRGAAAIEATGYIPNLVAGGLASSKSRMVAVLIPHLGSATVETRSAMARLAAHNAINVLNGVEPPTPIPVPAS